MNPVAGARYYAEPAQTASQKADREWNILTGKIETGVLRRIASIFGFIFFRLSCARLPEENEAARAGFMAAVQREFPNLTECNCPHLPVRLRISLEDQTVEAMERQFPNKDQQITLVSVGAGGCFQELVYLKKLSEKGYSNIKLLLIDPSFAKSTVPVQALRGYLANHLSEKSIQIEWFKDLESYRDIAVRDPKYKPHLLCLIDLNGENDPNRKPPRLDDYSFHFFKTNSLFQEDTLFSYTKCQGEQRARCRQFKGQDRLEGELVK